MSETELENAVVIGKAPMNTSGRSKYGLGLKTAACWFGDIWTVTTSKLNDNKEHSIEINVPEIAKHKMDLKHQTCEVCPEEHYTTIKIRKLHRKFHGKTVQKIKNYLRSMYRIDIKGYGLTLFWQDDLLTWNEKEEIFDRLIKNKEGELTRRNFSFKIGEKSIKGWAGVFEKGSRADAGFSIIQSERVIIGWPSSYRPTMLFGTQEGGRNDLINQRLVGELCLDGFDVSHTKDAILFVDDEEEELDNRLFEECSDLRKTALSYRKYKADERLAFEVKSDAAINEFAKELESNEIRDFLVTYEIPNEEIINKSNATIKESVIQKISPSIAVKIDKLSIKLYVVDNLSPNDPYVIIESTESKKRVIVIVNKAHPHWIHLENQESILNFLRHCTYDGVSEWKAYFLTKKLDPDTIKLIKDNLLRLPFEIEKHQA